MIKKRKRKKFRRRRNISTSKKNNLYSVVTVAAVYLSVILIAVILISIFLTKEPEVENTQPTTEVPVTELTVRGTVDEVPVQNTINTNAQMETEYPTQVATEMWVPDESQPQDLAELLSLQSQSFESVNSIGCKQIVTVTGDSINAEVRLYNNIDGLWIEDELLRCYGFVGQQGTVDNMSEDISGTPKGFYPIGSAFYRYNLPDTQLDVFQITEDTYWVDDPDSQYYNQRVEGTEQMDWNSAEHMIEYSNYDYGFVVNYNMPVQYNAGSAIFFHIGYGPTAGCIAVSEDMVLQYLSQLNALYNPCILIN